MTQSPLSDEDPRARADALRSQGPSAAGEAMRLYGSLREELDPTDPGDADRILWAASRSRGVNDHWAAVVDGVAARGATPEHRSTAAVVGAQLADHRGDAAEAERRYLAILGTERGSGSTAERAACLNLVRLLHLAGRDFEALVLGHLAHRLMLAAGDRWGLANAHLHRARILLGLGDLPRAEVDAQAAETLAGEVGAPRNRLLLVSLHGLRARLLLSQGDPRGALAELDWAEAATAPGDPLPLDPRLPRLLRAEALIHSGAPALGESLLADLDHGHDGPALEAAGLRSLAAALRGHRDEALEVARGLLHRLEGGEGDALPPGRRLHLASRLRRLFHERLGNGDGARRASGLAAAAMLERIHDLDRRLRLLPEATDATAEDLEILRAHRRRFTKEQEETLDEVAHMLEDAARRDGGSVLDLLLSGELVSMCAWCRRIRAPGGPWLAVQHYLPERVPFRLTHGICEVCSRAFMRGSS